MSPGLLLAAALLLQAPTPPPAPDSTQAVEKDSAPALLDCSGRCPKGGEVPRVTYFPQLQMIDADVRGGTRMHNFLIFEVVVTEDGIVEEGSIHLTSGAARSAQSEIERGLTQARFTPGKLNGTAVRTRVRIRFDFQAEGTNWVSYTYRVLSR
jgi:hypothetical protein